MGENFLKKNWFFKKIATQFYTKQVNENILEIKLTNFSFWFSKKVKEVRPTLAWEKHEKMQYIGQKKMEKYHSVRFKLPESLQKELHTFYSTGMHLSSWGPPQSQKGRGITYSQFQKG